MPYLNWSTWLIGWWLICMKDFINRMRRKKKTFFHTGHYIYGAYSHSNSCQQIDDNNSVRIANGNVLTWIFGPICTGLKKIAAQNCTNHRNSNDNELFVAQMVFQHWKSKRRRDVKRQCSDNSRWITYEFSIFSHSAHPIALDLSLISVL